jgi:uncharacterized protein
MSDASSPNVPPPNPYPGPPAMPADASPLERQWGMFAHLSQLLWLVLGPLGSIGGPLVIWLVKKDESAYIGWHGKEALNFQITLLIYMVILFVVGFVTCGIGWVLMGVLGLYMVVMAIIAGIRANEGKQWKYPFIFRLIS